MKYTQLQHKISFILLVHYVLWYELWTLSHFDSMEYEHWRWFQLWIWIIEVDDGIGYEFWRLSVWIVKLDDSMNYDWPPSMGQDSNFSLKNHFWDLWGHLSFQSSFHLNHSTLTLQSSFYLTPPNRGI